MCHEAVPVPDLLLLSAAAAAAAAAATGAAAAVVVATVVAAAAAAALVVLPQLSTVESSEVVHGDNAVSSFLGLLRSVLRDSEQNQDAMVKFGGMPTVGALMIKVTELHNTIEKKNGPRNYKLRYNVH